MNSTRLLSPLLATSVLLLLLRCQHVSGLRRTRVLEPEEVLATVKSTTVTLSIGQVQVHSVIPVFGGSEHFLAFLVPFDEKMWKELSILDLHCVDSQGQRTEVKFYGGETDAMYKKYIVGRCDWHAEVADRNCHEVKWAEGDRGEAAVQLKACHNAAQAKKGPYGLAACIRPPWEQEGHVESSGYLALPQWMEYYRKHGVQQFVAYMPKSPDPRYTQLLQPYISEGLATVVKLDQVLPYDSISIFALQELIGNDCLYRMRQRAQYLLPGHVDFDEYMVFGGAGAGHGSLNFHDALETLAKGEPLVHSLTFQRYTFRHPAEPLKDLQVSSRMREADAAHLCPKYVVVPRMCNALFTHWATSWSLGSKALALPPQILAGNHYRSQDQENTRTRDELLAIEAGDLVAWLAKTHGVPWSTLAAQLERQKVKRYSLLMKTMLASEDSGWDQLLADEAVAAWVKHLKSLSGPTLVDPPSAIS